MEIFDYSELIRVIDNVEIRENKERGIKLNNLKEDYQELERQIIASGIFEDWNKLKQLCNKARVRLCVSHQGEYSMGCVLGIGNFQYGMEYQDDGTFRKTMSSGSSWRDDYGFTYESRKGIMWRTWHTDSFHIFNGFENDEEEKYNTRIFLLKTFRDTYENYRRFLLSEIEKKFYKRIKAEDIIK